MEIMKIHNGILCAMEGREKLKRLLGSGFIAEPVSRRFIRPHK